MSERDDGGPAFPSADYAVPPDARDEAILQLKEKRGMTLRDYFAAKAMDSILSFEQTEPVGEMGSAENIAHSAYEMADAMLEARKR